MNKIDFCVIIGVRNANPNGDPLLSNRPRTTNEGYGIISNVCLKRKIRNRLQDMGNPIFIQSADRSEDDFSSLQERAEDTIPAELTRNPADYRAAACRAWMDVRSFGQVFAFSAKKKGRKTSDELAAEAATGISIGIRGPVTIQPAISVTPLDVAEMKITKSVNGTPAEKGKTKSSDTMGDLYSVPLGVYVTYGSINPLLADKTGFDEEDAEAIHEALKTLFENDESAARPSGSMEVLQVFWWTHETRNGSQPSGVVHRSVTVTAKSDHPLSFSDFEITHKEVPGVKLDLFTTL